MTDLLTLNGVPVTQAGSITIAERDAIMDAFVSKNFALWCLGDNPPPALQPIKRIVDGMVGTYTKWGTTLIPESCSIKLWANDLPAGSTTFAGTQDENWHGDDEDAPEIPMEDDKMVLRMLWASTQHPKYIDLTGNPRMRPVMNKHRNYATVGYKYHPTIEQAAIEHGGRIIIPDESAVMAFDGTTGHKPFLLDQAERRILVSAWYEMYLPGYWRARVAEGDVPRLGL